MIQRCSAESPQATATVTLPPAVLDIDLASPQGAALLAATAAAHGPRLAPAAHRLSRLFLIRSPWAPGLRFAGGQAHHDGGPGALCDPRIFSQSGPSETLEGALAACIGEAIEHLSQIERPGDIAQTGCKQDVAALVPQVAMPFIADQLTAAGRPPHAPLRWMRGRLIADGRDVLVPAGWCVRRSPGRTDLSPPWILGSGVAAGPGWDWAASRALLELVERDAAALWWRGGQRGRPISLHDPALAEACRLAAHLRQGESARSCWLLDITTDLDIPCAVAISTDPDGRGVVCGFGARLSLAEAVRSAILENAQMELALLLARAKAPEGAASSGALTATERQHLDLATLIDAGTCDLLQPTGACRAPVHVRTPDTGGEALPTVAAALTTAGIAAVLVDLTRPDFGLPVVRAIAPGLQPAPSPIVTSRLQKTLTEMGGGTRFTRDVPIF